MRFKKLIALVLTATMLSGVITLGVLSADVEKVSADNRYTVHQNKYAGKYDLREGIFTYSSTSGADRDAVYYYSDGYFETSPDVYNEHLSTMSLALAMSAFNATATEFDLSLYNKYANSFRNAKQLLSDIGFEDKNIRVNDSFTRQPTDDSIGVIMGAKELSVDGYILLPVIVRGGGYESEWASNVTLGKSGEAKGFSESASKVISELEKFILSDLSLDVEKALQDGRVKFLVCGYSRAAAVANITAKRLTDKYGKENSIYAYCFEAPRGGADSAVINEAHTYNGQYLNIHNIINPGDLVTYVAPEKMGFIRYGVDRLIPDMNDDAYSAKREKMTSQLSLINDSIVFSDTFSLATLNYLGFALGTSGIFMPLQNVEVTASEWLAGFMNDLTKWTTNGENEESCRDFYVSNKSFCGEEYVTVEKALQTFTKLLFGMENSEAFADAMMHRVKALTENKMLIADFYMSVVGSWEKLVYPKQKQYLDTIWNILTNEQQYEDGASVPGITDFVSEKESVELKNSTYTLFAFLFSFVNKDNTTAAIENITSTQVHLATLLYNAGNILQCHYPEICMAWLRADDSHYEKNDELRYEEATVLLDVDNVVIPAKIEASGEKTAEGISISLVPLMNGNDGEEKKILNSGLSLYYQIYENGQLLKDWSLYQTPITLDNKEGAEYSIKAFAAHFGTKTDVFEITQEQMIIAEDESSSTIIIISSVIIAVLALGVGGVIYFKKKEKNNA